MNTGRSVRFLDRIFSPQLGVATIRMKDGNVSKQRERSSEWSDEYTAPFLAVHLTMRQNHKCTRCFLSKKVIMVDVIYIRENLNKIAWHINFGVSLACVSQILP